MRRYMRLAALGTTVLLAVPPFGCLGDALLPRLTPILLDEGFSLLDRVIFTLAPLVLP